MYVSSSCLSELWTSANTKDASTRNSHSCLGQNWQRDVKNHSQTSVVVIIACPTITCPAHAPNTLPKSASSGSQLSYQVSENSLGHRFDLWSWWLWLLRQIHLESQLHLFSFSQKAHLQQQNDTDKKERHEFPNDLGQNQSHFQRLTESHVTPPWKLIWSKTFFVVVNKFSLCHPIPTPMGTETIS